MTNKKTDYLLDTSLTPKERIEKFLSGYDPQERIYAIESYYGKNTVDIFIEDPVNGKRVETHMYTPFTFIKNFKEEGRELFPPDVLKYQMKNYGINVIPLKTDKNPRLESGYKFILESNKTGEDIKNFFYKAGVNIYQSPMISSVRGEEQFLINTGKRLFKGYEKYSDVHKFYFDIETTSLEADNGHIFLIGMKDNRGFQQVLSIDKNDPIESEKRMIVEFFNTIIDLKPSIVAGYNSENFDFTYIIGRAEILGLAERDQKNKIQFLFPTSIHPQNEFPLKRKASTIKLGGETENYEQTLMWGINVIDIAHSVRKAQAINSEIKSWSLKYITKFAEKNKPNRMYVKGDEIYKLWDENQNFIINKENSEYKLIPGAYQSNPDLYITKLKDTFGKQTNVVDFFGSADNIGLITGKEIINQYLIDDLWETEQVDETYNQASFMLAANIPTGFVRVSTMGNASVWKLLMTAYSYEARVAIPKNMKKESIVGGLSRLVTVGYAKNILKLDFSSLYPSIQLTHDVFPTCDITNVFKDLLNYFRDSRLYYKALAGTAKAAGDMETATMADTKQLPIKILINSMFGALSAPEIFPWADNAIGERITCTGRQYLRQMVHFFIGYGFTPLLMDTDGVNFSLPDNVEDLSYIDKNGKEYKGYMAPVIEYNEKFMHGAMGLDEDGVWDISINFARKNYVNKIYDKKKKKEKIKLTGAMIKSKKIAAYIEDFLEQGLKYLLEDRGKDFINLYNTYIENIYNGQIPLIKVASKAKVKSSVDDYKLRANMTNKNGGSLPKQAHMEAIIASNLKVSLGDVIYFVNNGEKKTSADVGNVYIIDEKEFINDPNKLGEYNIPRALHVFNNKVKPLLVCFNSEIRDSILIDNPKNKEIFTDDQLKLTSGQPIKVEDQDVLYLKDFIAGAKGHKNEPIFEMSEREIMFWNRVGIDPKEIFADFTTELSQTKLEVENVKEKVKIILDFFQKEGVTLKWMLERYTTEDQVLYYEDTTNKWFVATPVKDELEKGPEIDVTQLLQLI